MTIISPNTLFIGKNYIYLEECESTNSLLLDELGVKNIAEGTLLFTNHQQKGRGQMGNIWLSEAGVNLTFSLVIIPKWLKIEEQFCITKLVSVALISLLNQYKSGFEIKWPNDIYFNNKKVAGILIENSINKNVLKNVVIGVGLNVNQEELPERAVSLSEIVEEEIDRKVLLEKFCEVFEANYLKLKQNTKCFDREYLSYLYRRGEVHSYRNKKDEIRNQKLFKGEIVGVSDIGKLKVNVAGKLGEFGMKEIEFVN